MKAWKAFFLTLLFVAVIVAAFGLLFIQRGFRATNQPSRLEAVVSRAARNFSIPGASRDEKNPGRGYFGRICRMVATPSCPL